MRVVLKVVSGLVLIWSTSASAVPPPFVTSQEHIARILADERVRSGLQQGAIESILRIESGYKVVTAECSIEVKLLRDPRFAMGPVPLGPIPYVLQVGEAQCTSRTR